MLSLHGIMICSLRGMLSIQKCMLEGYFKNTVWDIFTANIQPYLNVYALKNPLVYQYKLLGGQQSGTLINYINKDDKIIPNDWINKTNVSIVTMNQTELIPKDIILTWKNYNVPDHILQKWQDLNPDFNIKFFDDNNIIEFLKEEYDDTYVIFFKCLKFGMYKADFFRYCYLYKYGGYYFDIDIEPVLSITEIIDYKINYCSVLSMINEHIFQAVLCTNKHNPIIKLCIDDMLYYGSNIGIDPPNKPPYNGHPTKCMYDNIVKYTGKKVLKEGIININNENILLGKEFNHNNRIAIRLNDKIFGYSRYENYKRDIGFKENDINLIKVGKSETNSKTIRLYKQYPHDTILTFKHKYKDTFDYNFEDKLLTIIRTDENLGWGQDLVAYLSSSSNDNSIDYLFKDLGTIEKKIHISWKTKNILNLDFNIIKYGIKQLKEFNPDYTFEISDDDDVEKYIMDKISKEDYDLIKNRDIVEKTDLWRLLKIFYEGGIYMDIDRFYNSPMNKIIKKDIKCILPTCGDIDFSQDIMISASNNIIYKTAIDLNLKKRKDGCNHLFTLGPITYFDAVTQILLGRSIPRSKSNENWHILRQIINDSKFVDTYREDAPYNTLVYRGVKINNDKRNFYNYCDVNHWTTRR
jgi:mannosyltransferase OCH1-like enzyme